MEGSAAPATLPTVALPMGSAVLNLQHASTSSAFSSNLPQSLPQAMALPARVSSLRTAPAQQGLTFLPDSLLQDQELLQQLLTAEGQGSEGFPVFANILSTAINPQLSASSTASELELASGIAVVSHPIDRSLNGRAVLPITGLPTGQPVYKSLTATESVHSLLAQDVEQQASRSQSLPLQNQQPLEMVKSDSQTYQPAVEVSQQLRTLEPLTVLKTPITVDPEFQEFNELIKTTNQQPQLRAEQSLQNPSLQNHGLSQVRSDSPLSPQTSVESAEALKLLANPTRSFQEQLSGQAIKGEQMGERLMVMLNKDQRQATLRMDPPELGQLKIMLKVDGDQVAVQFQAGNAQLRDMLNQQVDRLRQFFDQQQMNLVNVDISHERSMGEGRGGEELLSSRESNITDTSMMESQISALATPSQATGLLDIYA
ncbi:flagellar hook-length control protein FliK [Parendozoicomonas haliclonae]|uniref:Flagellar hook-length control protein FliK n=1 Tax=Parendozoicomonas haliclonae TaxID=1960125 RepID=A0A1X7AGF7_9GAMM|nr:flagellar hook-length control protein FliK [Parendozoicomonas haliclonae]SMA39842.1 Flagellar hook-length control protein FliK [Parendozoicomonas haliclonae]